MGNSNPLIIILFFVALFLWVITIGLDFGRSDKRAKLVSDIDQIHNVICYRFDYHDGIQCYKLNELKS
jgi:hypothetical protein